MIATLLVLLCSSFAGSYGQGTRAELFDEKITQATSLFSGLEAIKFYFSNSTNPLAAEILKTFETDCIYMDEPDLPHEKHRQPFIVIEGNNRNSREVVGVRLARMMNGRYLIHPAPCLLKFVDAIPRGTLFRRAFYILSLYAMSFLIRVHLNLGRAVILNGYWLDQLSFALVQTLPGTEMPPATSDLFRTPEGLLQPDLLIYLNFPDNLFVHQMTTRSPSSWKTRVVSLYKGLQSRHPIVVQDLQGVFRVTTDQVYQHVCKQLAGRGSLSAPRNNFNSSYQWNGLQHQ